MEILPLEACLGRTPALEIRAKGPMPSIPSARHRGMAVATTRRRSLEQIDPDSPEPPARLDPRQAWAVEPYDPLPLGTEAVAHPTRYATDGWRVSLLEALNPNDGIQPVGSLAERDQVLVGTHRPLELGDLERLEALGFKELQVRRRPKVAWAHDGPAGTAELLATTGAQVVRERSLQWPSDAAESVDARFWLGAPPPPDSVILPSGETGFASSTWFRTNSGGVEVGLSDRLYEAWVGLWFMAAGLFEAWGVALPPSVRQHARLAEPVDPAPYPVPVKVAEAANQLPLVWKIPKDAAHVMARADGVIVAPPRRFETEEAVTVWLLPTGVGAVRR